MLLRVPENTISVNEAMRIAGVTERTIRLWISKKDILTYKVGRRIWIDKENFKNFVYVKGISTLENKENENSE